MTRLARRLVAAFWVVGLAGAGVAVISQSASADVPPEERLACPLQVEGIYHADDAVSTATPEQLVQEFLTVYAPPGTTSRVHIDGIHMGGVHVHSDADENGLPLAGNTFTLRQEAVLEDENEEPVAVVKMVNLSNVGWKIYQTFACSDVDPADLTRVTPTIADGQIIDPYVDPY